MVSCNTGCMFPRFPPHWLCELSSFWTLWLPHYQTSTRSELRRSHRHEGRLICVDTTTAGSPPLAPCQAEDILQDRAASLLCDMVSLYRPGHSLRAADSLLLTEPRVRLDLYGARSFSFAAPTVWNCLPLDLRKLSNVNSFSSALRTLLFDPSTMISGELGIYFEISFWMPNCLLYSMYCERFWSVVSDCKGRYINLNILLLLQIEIYYLSIYAIKSANFRLTCFHSHWPISFLNSTMTRSRQSWPN